jgi:hypothetical protein
VDGLPHLQRAAASAGAAAAFVASAADISQAVSQQPCFPAFCVSRGRQHVGARLENLKIARQRKGSLYAPKVAIDCPTITPQAPPFPQTPFSPPPAVGALLGLHFLSILLFATREVQ